MFIRPFPRFEIQKRKMTESAGKGIRYSDLL